jgi:hypothetical protein
MTSSAAGSSTGLGELAVTQPSARRAARSRPAGGVAARCRRRSRSGSLVAGSLARGSCPAPPPGRRRASSIWVLSGSGMETESSDCAAAGGRRGWRAWTRGWVRSASGLRLRPPRTRLVHTRPLAGCCGIVLVARVIANPEPGGAQLSMLRVMREQRGHGLASVLYCGSATADRIELARRHGAEPEVWGRGRGPAEGPGAALRRLACPGWPPPTSSTRTCLAPGELLRAPPPPAPRSGPASTTSTAGRAGRGAPRCERRSLASTSTRTRARRACSARNELIERLFQRNPGGPIAERLRVPSAPRVSLLPSRKQQPCIDSRHSPHPLRYSHSRIAIASRRASPPCRYVTPAHVVPMHRVRSVEPCGAPAARPRQSFR